MPQTPIGTCIWVGDFDQDLGPVPTRLWFPDCDSQWRLPGNQRPQPDVKPAKLDRAETILDRTGIDQATILVRIRRRPPFRWRPRVRTVCPLIGKLAGTHDDSYGFIWP